MVSWFDKSQRMERFSQVNYRRVKAQDYIKLMRLVEKKPAGLPATSDMTRLLDKMISDLEDAIVTIYRNTVAAGHTSIGMKFPCPDCASPISTFEQYMDVWSDNHMLVHYWNMNDYLESDDYLGEDPDDMPDEIRNAFESQQDSPYGGDGLFVCETCNKVMHPDDLDQYMENPFPGGRDILISDQIDLIVKYIDKVKAADSFERKFPYFEGIIEWVHGSGDMSHWFIEGGDTTIDNYRSSKFPSRHDEYNSWRHPHYRDKDWDWSKI